MVRLISVFLIFFFTLISTDGFSQDLDHIRNNYHRAIKDKSTCKALIDELKAKEKEINSIELAYFGALETIWANHVINPFSKLKTFRKGKEKIENAAKQTPKNIEISYLRLSVQKNAPSFLGYNDNIKEDTEFLKENRHQIKSIVLQKNVESLLSE